MTERRRYTKREKAVAVTAALASSVKAAAEQTGVPRTTLIYWMESPEFDILRQKTRDDLAKGFELMAHRSQEVLIARIPEMEPRDLTLLLAIATDKAQLLTGAATARTETRDLTAALDDHERDALADAIDEWLAGRTDATAGEHPEPVGAEVRE